MKKNSNQFKIKIFKNIDFVCEEKRRKNKRRGGKRQRMYKAREIRRIFW